jgi:hypothetical protein
MSKKWSFSSWSAPFVHLKQKIQNLTEPWRKCLIAIEICRNSGHLRFELILFPVPQMSGISAN